MNKLSAVNLMLSQVSQQPVNSLTGNLTTRVVLAKNILEDTVENVQLTGYYFNSEKDYPLYTNQDGEILLDDNILRVDVIDDNDEYVQHGSKLYCKTNHTYKINKNLKTVIVKKLEFDALPPIAQRYIVMVAANDFVAKVKQDKVSYAFSSAQVSEAKAKLEETEIDVSNSNILDGMDRRRGL